MNRLDQVDYRSLTGGLILSRLPPASPQPQHIFLPSPIAALLLEGASA